MAYDEDLRRGALFMVVSSALFASMGLAVRVTSATLPNPVIVFFRSVFGLIALLPWAARLRRHGLGTRALPEHLARGVAGLAAMYCFFFAIGRLGLAEATLLNYTLPLWMPMIARVWLGEPIPPGLSRALVIGFTGVLLILKPGPGLFQPAALVGLLAGLLAATAQVGVRRLTETEPVTRIVFYFALISSVVSALPLAVSWRAPEGTAWVWLVAMGLLATLGQLLLTRAYAHAPAAQVGPFIYSTVAFATLLEGLYFAHWPDALAVAGGLLVCLGGIQTLRRVGAPAPA